MKVNKIGKKIQGFGFIDSIKSCWHFQHPVADRLTRCFRAAKQYLLEVEMQRLLTSKWLSKRYCVFDYVCFRFDLYFRKNPFGGEYTIFAGLEECIRFIANFKLTEEEITFVRDSLPGSCEVLQTTLPVIVVMRSCFCFLFSLQNKII